jgi:hypothetical protein
MEFRPAPSYPGYSASRDGTIRRDPWAITTKLGKTLHRPARIVSRITSKPTHVMVDNKWTKAESLVEDAWRDDDRPKPIPGGRVITLQEHWAELIAKRDAKGKI